MPFSQPASAMSRIPVHLVKAHDWTAPMEAGNFRALSSGCPIGVFQADVDGNVSYANAAIAEIWQMPIYALLGKGWVQRVHPEDRSTLLTKWSEANMEGRTYETSYRLMHPDGGVSYLSGQSSLVRDPLGRICGTVGTVIDVTERELAGRYHARRNQVLAAVAQNQPALVSMRIVAEALEEQRPAHGCIVLLLKGSRPYWTAGSRTPRELVELVRRELESLHSQEPEDAFCRPLKARGLTSCLRRISGIASRAGFANVQQVEVLSSEGRPIGAVLLLGHQNVASSSGADALLKEATSMLKVAYESRLRYSRLLHQAEHDPLTGLPNRAAFQNLLAEILEQCRKAGGKAAVLSLDIDRFRQINDRLGTTLADTFLTLVARRLRNRIRRAEVLARTGGDQFLLLLPDIQNGRDASRVANRLLRAMREPFSAGDQELVSSISIGISLFPKDGQNATTLVRHAEHALQQAKGMGRNAFQFSSRCGRVKKDAFRTEDLLRNALRHELFEIHYQPQYAADGKIHALEALLRLKQNGQLIPPAHFIPIAEESGLIIPIGEWVIRRVCLQSLQWQAAGKSPLPIAVNVSALQFARRDFQKRILSILDETGLPPTLLELELTESMLFKHVRSATEQMARLAERGIRFAVDDFGTGYSSLAYLHQLPVHTLKIDRSFVQDMLKPGGTGPIVSGILSMARSLQLKTVAEGVDCREQRDALVQQGCDLIQGFLYSQPVEAHQIAQLLSM